MNIPVVDEIYQALVKGELDKLGQISRPKDAIHIRIAMSTDYPKSAALDIDLEDITKRAPWITPFFAGPRVHFTTASTALQASLSGGSSNVLIDWSFSFDSNVAERVRAYVNHEKINQKDKERVITLLQLKKQYALQTDLLPFLFENLRLSRENKRNERPFNTIVAFKKLDHIDWEAFEIDADKPIFNCNDDEILADAKSTYYSLLTQEEVLKREYKALFTQVFLFELAIRWIQQPNEPEIVFSNLIEFCILQLKKLPKSELLIAHRFLNNPKGSEVRFFGPLADLGKDLIKDLKGMAWDLSHIRTMETASTLSQFGAFFLPFFVSFDSKFSDILKQNQIRYLIVDDRLRRMHSVGDSELDFQYSLNNAMSDKVKIKMTPEESEIRRNYTLPLLDLQQIASYQEQALIPVAAVARKNKPQKKVRKKQQ
jgi:hypothetical protein